LEGRIRSRSGVQNFPAKRTFVKQILPYISVGQDEGNRCIVVVEDYELFDFVEDFLSDECDLSYEYRTSKERPGGEIITMFFPLSVNPEVIEASLSSLSPLEVERIYKLNN
jgi:hypothetical protein